MRNANRKVADGGEGRRREGIRLCEKDSIEEDGKSFSIGS